MLQELANESENQYLKMNKSKTKVMMENDTPINNTQIENIESHVYLGQRYSTIKKTKTTRFKEELRPDSPGTAASSRVTLEHA